MAQGREQAVFYRDEVMTAMKALRTPVDKPVSYTHLVQEAFDQVTVNGVSSNILNLDAGLKAGRIS